MNKRVTPPALAAAKKSTTNKSLSSKSAGGRPSQADALRLHNAILDAAEKLFLEHGFSDTTMEAIAQASGAAKKTLYAKFGTKEALFVAVDARILALLRREMESEGTFEQRLVAICQEMLREMLNPKMVKIYSIITGEARRFPMLAQRAEGITNFPIRKMFYEMIELAAADGTLVCNNPRRAAEQLETLVVMAPLNWTILGIRKMSRSERDEWIHDAIDLFFSRYRPAEARGKSKR